MIIQPLKKDLLRAREGDRGGFDFLITTNNNVPDYNSDSTAHLIVNFRSEYVSIPFKGVLDCRIKGVLA